MNTVNVKRVFPMHFGREFSVIERYKTEMAASLRGTVLTDIRQAEQEWEINL